MTTLRPFLCPRCGGPAVNVGGSLDPRFTFVRCSPWSDKVKSHGVLATFLDRDAAARHEAERVGALAARRHARHVAGGKIDRTCDRCAQARYAAAATPSGTDRAGIPPTPMHPEGDQP